MKQMNLHCDLYYTLIVAVHPTTKAAWSFSYIVIENMEAHKKLDSSFHFSCNPEHKLSANILLAEQSKKEYKGF